LSIPQIPGEPTADYPSVRAPHGAGLSCKGWQQEAALRMLMNSLDPEIAERPDALLARDGLGRAVAGSIAFRATVDALRALDSDETLLVRSCKPAGVFPTREDAPRVLVADSDTAADWTYIGPQGFLPAADEILGAAARKHFDGDLAGKLIASGSMSGACGALSLAATMNGGAFLGIDGDPDRVKRRVKTGYCDVMVNDLDEALRILKNAVRKREAASVGLARDSADVIPEMASRGVVPDLLIGANDSYARVREAVETLKGYGAVVVASERLTDTADQGCKTLLCVALSGEAADIQRVDRLILELFAANENLCRWIKAVKSRVRHQGLPARAFSLAAEERRTFGAAVNELVSRGELKAPIMLARDRATPSADAAKIKHGDSGMLTGANELSVLLGQANGATMALFRRCDDRADKSQIIAQAVVSDGTKEMAVRIERVFAHEV
jgi:urocanate hydratase